MKRAKTKIIRKKLLDSGRPYQCEECGQLPVWNNKPLVIEIHHVDGDNTNNELNNLQFLCPHCHSQTENFRFKKGAKNPKPKVNRIHSCTKCAIEVVTHSRGVCISCRKRKNITISNDELISLIQQKSVKEIANDLGVTDRAIYKRYAKIRV